ncbi:conserved hypothetical protein [Hyella patelloides LEGE 07179]|uniref:Coiled coil domain-containing protein n=1 Tax=Hyella patelloides LEGE 07179 TaxID=945734 RepID=A0A563VLG4_9CYAN|nr:hypothetical protein [Hyella patelloides]VEP12290.1 conserved hypothetical protein [Hyella patelloides LEGE 07179]
MSTDSNTKQAYQEKVKAQLDKLNTQIDEFKVKSEQAKANAKIEYQDKMAELYTKRDAAQVKLQELQQSSGEAWTEIQKGFEKAWTELSSAWDIAVDKFK